MDLADWRTRIDDSHARISQYIGPTPLKHSPSLSEELQCDVWLKMECEQPTGSFKVRGALNKTMQTNLSLKEGDTRPPLITASSGNHGRACCYAWKILGREGIIFVPYSITRNKEEKLKEARGIEVRKVGQETAEAEVAGRRFADKEGFTFISPYNDVDIIAGAGTIGKEILTQLNPPPDVVAATVGGGGLMSGIAAYIKAVLPSVHLIGCQPALDAVMAQSVRAGRIVSYEEAMSRPTLSQGSAGGVEEGSMTFPLCRDLVDEWILVDELSIARSVEHLQRSCDGLLVEPSAALPLAALMKEPARWRGKRVVLVMSGANVGADEVTQIRDMCAAGC